jgi:rubrerythrin
MLKDKNTVSQFTPVSKGSETEKNLLTAFAGEAQARNKYTYFAQIAEDEGMEQVAAIFLETANNEKEHAKIIYKLMGEWTNTAANLNKAIAGEHYEWTKMYKGFEVKAKEEGFKDAAIFFKEVGEIEEKHEERYKKLLANLKNKEVFKKKKEVIWVCRNCGYVHRGVTPPKECPNCHFPQAYFEVKAENY